MNLLPIYRRCLSTDGTSIRGEGVYLFWIIKKYKTITFDPKSTNRTNTVDLKTSREMGDKTFRQASFVMITGDKVFSQNNADYLTNFNSVENKNGEKMKLISRAGAEGLDYKNIRQLHVLEPCYNMNRIK